MYGSSSSSSKLYPSVFFSLWFWESKNFFCCDAGRLFFFGLVSVVSNCVVRYSSLQAAVAVYASASVFFPFPLPVALSVHVSVSLTLPKHANCLSVRMYVCVCSWQIIFSKPKGGGGLADRLAPSPTSSASYARHRGSLFTRGEALVVVWELNCCCSCCCLLLMIVVVVVLICHLYT